MGRDNSLDTIILQVHQGLVKKIQRLPVVLPDGLLKVRAPGLAQAALDAGPAAGLVADPETDDLDAVGGELGDVGLLLRVGHALHEVVAGAGPGLGALAFGRGGGGAQGKGRGDDGELHLGGW